MYDHRVKLDLLAGTHLDEALAKARDISEQLLVTVYFCFNGDVYFVNPKETIHITREMLISIKEMHIWTG